MGGLGSILVLLTLASAGSPGALDAQLEGAVSDLGLPRALAASLSIPAIVRWHENDGWSRAWYEAVDPRAGGVVHLSRRHYARGWGLRPIAELTVDDAEYLFRALLGARLEISVARQDPTGRTILAQSERMQSAPQAVRTEAYVDALASFGSHLLSMATEIGRKERARRAAGSSLCPRVSEDLPLLRLWTAAFERGTFPGAFSTGPGGRGVAWTSEVLTPAERRWLVDRILETGWVGDPAVDLEPILCESEGRH